MTVNTATITKHLDWMRERNLATSTIRTRADALGALTASHTDILHIDPATIRAVLDSRAFCPATRNLWRAHFSAFFRWAIDEELATSNPMRRVPRVEQPENLPRPISETALERALATADPRMRAWLTLGAYAGLRAAEISGVIAENVSTDIGTLRIVGKRRKTRIVPMHPRVVDALAPFARTTGRLWPNPPRVVTMYISRHLHQLGYADTAHSLRHRFATSVYDSTGDINLVRELLGHSSTATTQIYARVSVTRMRTAVALIA